MRRASFSVSLKKYETIGSFASASCTGFFFGSTGALSKSFPSAFSYLSARACSSPSLRHAISVDQQISILLYVAAPSFPSSNCAWNDIRSIESACCAIASVMSNSGSSSILLFSGEYRIFFRLEAFASLVNGCPESVSWNRFVRCSSFSAAVFHMYLRSSVIWSRPSHLRSIAIVEPLTTTVDKMMKHVYTRMISGTSRQYSEPFGAPGY